MYRGHPNPYVRARSELPWAPSADDPRSQVIPLRVWQLTDIRAIAEAQLGQPSSSLIVPITDKCNTDIQNLELTTTDLAERLLRLGDANYDKSMWCRGSRKDGVKVSDEALWFPCDAYVLKVREMVRTNWEGTVEYYLKLCLTPANKVILLVSVHL